MRAATGGKAGPRRYGRRGKVAPRRAAATMEQRARRRRTCGGRSGPRQRQKDEAAQRGAATGRVVAQIETLSSGTMLPLDSGEKNERERERAVALLCTYEEIRYMGHMGLDIPNTPLQTQGGSGGSEALSLSK